jgi:type IV secretory pathway TraG/TraD family ATPase VirD4
MKSTDNNVPVSLIIDEAYVLGHFEELEIAASILRGFNCRQTMCFQSYGQIRQLYPETHGLFTSGMLVSFRPADIDTGRFLVERAGKITLPVLSAADPSSPSDFMVRPSWQQQDRDRIPLAKMMAMPRGRALVWKPGDEAPRQSWMKGYFDIPELAARATGQPASGTGNAASNPLPMPPPGVGHHAGNTVKMIAIVALLAAAVIASHVAVQSHSIRPAAHQVHKIGPGTGGLY